MLVGACERRTSSGRAVCLCLALIVLCVLRVTGNREDGAGGMTCAGSRTCIEGDAREQGTDGEANMWNNMESEGEDPDGSRTDLLVVVGVGCYKEDMHTDADVNAIHRP